MCGITRILDRANQVLVNAMTEALAHRGPDDSGKFTLTRDQVAPGHRSLRHGIA
ncbi:MAG: hypothetical protein ONB48_15880 [candidate division KSB1 bacterium]|nr:hypothetical protein [candidate division KSB1 bacterium]MDZ7276093.1 hypothetical protein [candidate division KSB1 bacterium]MDZ7287127.1 hypothetical protein [candidate division KSB1 bacterium]MDZ7296948.1 hypothetical protein [candidate division KSB1 bacterium]MDZ7307161.1 hypothetical protein [candidate division KSB1 bacterium]